MPKIIKVAHSFAKLF